MNSSIPLVFVVEDDQDVCDSLMAVVTASGYSCLTFGSSEECLSTLLERDCDCLIVDVDLPGTSGLEFLRQLHRIGCQIPSMLFTGRITDPILETAASLGGIPVLQKGLNAGLIRETLRELVGVGTRQ